MSGPRPEPNPYAGDLLSHADAAWKSTATSAALTLARCGQDFTADELSDMGVREPNEPAYWGSLFSSLKRRGLILAVGYRASRQESRNGGVLRIWRGTAKALELEAVAA